MEINESTIDAIRKGTMSVPRDVTYEELWKLVVLPECVGTGAWGAYRQHSNDIIWRSNLMPLIGHELVRDTTWRSAKAALMTIPNASTRMGAATLWSRICSVAVREGIVERNPIVFSYMRLPKPERRPKRLLAAPELAAWLDVARGSEFEALLLCQLGGGMCKEEACALTCEDIERHEQSGRAYAVVSIDKSLAYPARKVLQRKCKTPASTRRVVIGEPFASRILELASDGAGPLAPNPRCSEIAPPYTEEHYDSPRRYLTHARELFSHRRDVCYVPPAYLRNTWSTWHDEAGSPDSLVSRTMGHAGSTMRDMHYVVASLDNGVILADNLTRYLYERNPTLAPRQGLAQRIAKWVRFLG